MRMKLSVNRYGCAFYADRDAQTQSAARVILSHLFKVLQIESICDVGCGVGTWLAMGRELGAHTIQGFEAPWVADRDLAVERELIVARDLERELPTNRRFDLVISLEVAEHLPSSRAKGFVNDLCALGDIVLFSAAIPRQGGIRHVNERWQSYWAKVFLENDYGAFDFIRPKVWTDKTIPWWYRQNALVYARHGSLAATILADEEVHELAKLNLVHPELYARRTQLGPLQALRAFLLAMIGRIARTHHDDLP